MPEITIYTDGSALGNPGPGGYGAVLISGRFRKEVSQGYRLTTNNRMELLAVCVALEMLKFEGSDVTIYSDSKYVVDAVEKRWVVVYVTNDFIIKIINNTIIYIFLLRHPSYKLLPKAYFWTHFYNSRLRFNPSFCLMLFLYVRHILFRIEITFYNFSFNNIPLIYFLSIFVIQARELANGLFINAPIIHLR